MRALPLVLVAACSGSPAAPDAAPLAPTANPDREVVDTKLAFDVGALTATATITLGPSTAPGATLEVGDLAIESVRWQGADLPYAIASQRMDLALPALAEPAAIDIAYRFTLHEMSNGASAKGFTLLWPYYCGNLFPCHSQPADGTPFALAITGVPAGKVAVYPPTIPADA